MLDGVPLNQSPSSSSRFVDKEDQELRESKSLQEDSFINDAGDNPNSTHESNVNCRRLVDYFVVFSCKRVAPSSDGSDLSRESNEDEFFGTATPKDKDVVEGNVERRTKGNDIADVSQHSLLNASEAQDGVMLTPPSLKRDRYTDPNLLDVNFELQSTHQDSKVSPKQRSPAFSRSSIGSKSPEKIRQRMNTRLLHFENPVTNSNIHSHELGNDQHKSLPTPLDDNTPQMGNITHKQIRMSPASKSALSPGRSYRVPVVTESMITDDTFEVSNAEVESVPSASSFASSFASHEECVFEDRVGNDMETERVNSALLTDEGSRASESWSENENLFNEGLNRQMATPSRAISFENDVDQDIVTPSTARARDVEAFEATLERMSLSHSPNQRVDVIDDKLKKYGEEPSMEQSSQNIKSGEIRMHVEGAATKPAANTSGMSENIHLPSTTDRVGNSDTIPTFSPFQSARYPVMDHKDSPLNPMISHFCFPHTHDIELQTEYKMPTIHHFVLTNDKGTKIYGTCLTVYEEYESEEEFDGEESFFNQIRHSNSDTILESPDSVEISLSSTMKPITLYLPKCICLLSSWPYLQAFREYLSQLYRLATMTNLMEAPIERYVMNICQEIPAPPPGVFEIRLRILSSIIKFWAPPANQPIPYVSIPFAPLFECLDVDNVIFVWYALTLERKVLLVSSQYSLLTHCSEILCSLLFPMQWCHLYIPILPKFLSPMLDAPMPYLCGISRDNLTPDVIGDISEETIMVDLDKNIITMGHLTPPFPPMPLKRRSKLEKALNSNAGDIFWEARGLSTSEVVNGFVVDGLDNHTMINHTNKLMEKAGRVWEEKLRSYDDAFNLAYTPDSETLLNGQNAKGGSFGNEQTQWDCVQEAFLRFHVTTLKGYRRFIVWRPKDTAYQSLHKQYFKTKKFIKAQRSVFKPFLKEFCCTQQFDNFITKRMYYKKDPDVVFFDQSIQAKINRSKMTLKKKQTPFLQSAKAHKKLKTIDAVQPVAFEENNSETGGAVFNLLDRFYATPTKGDRKFAYSSWPETFDHRLFGIPRPIPASIAAEFDKRAGLDLRLKAHQSEIDDFRHGHSHESIETATFTLFFSLYCSTVGKELSILRNQVNDKSTKSSALSELVQSIRSINVNEKKPEMKNEGNEFDCIHWGFAPDCSLQSLCAPCGDVLERCAFPAEASSAHTQALLEQTTPLRNKVLRRLSQNAPVDEQRELQIDEAKVVANAQLDLAFSTLNTLYLRKEYADVDGYKFLMDACGRCGSTTGATELMANMRQERILIDGEIYSKYLQAFSVANEIRPDEPIESPLTNVPLSDNNDLYLNQREKEKKWFNHFKTPNKVMTDDSLMTTETSEQSSNVFDGASSQSSKPDYMITPTIQVSTKKRKKLTRKEELQVTEQVDRHMAIGDSLLEYLYNDLKLDATNACPQCSKVLNEDEVMMGWNLCSFTDFNTKCNNCNQSFVPTLVVTSSTSTFEGSQGVGTPLFCELFSPWVLRKQLYMATNNCDIDDMLHPDWRKGTDINSTLWWNLIFAFKRQKLPITFLLQGSFKDRLIMPMDAS